MGRRTPFGPVLRAAFVAIVIGSVLVAAGALARAEQPVAPAGGPHDVQPLTTIVYTGNGSAEGGNTPGPWTCGSFQDDPNTPGLDNSVLTSTTPGRYTVPNNGTGTNPMRTFGVTLRLEF